jgi:hypothetical protein
MRSEDVIRLFDVNTIGGEHTPSPANLYNGLPVSKDTPVIAPGFSGTVGQLQKLVNSTGPGYGLTGGSRKKQTRRHTKSRRNRRVRRRHTSRRK